MKMRQFIPWLLLTLTAGAAYPCQEGDKCSLPDGKVGLCLNHTCLERVEIEPRQNLMFSVVVRYPRSRLISGGGSNIFIRGNGLGLQWSRGIKLTNADLDTWAINITYQALFKGYMCQNCADRTRLPDNKLQYRLLIDDHVDMLGANFAVVFPISQSSSYFSRKPEYIVHPWFYEKTGLIQSVVVNSHYIGGDRNISIYTPPSFKENTLKTYPTFVVLDLSIQFAHFFKTTIEEPIYPYGVVEEYVIIGFGDYHTDTERTDLLTQSVGRFFQCLNGTLGDGCGGCVPSNSNTTETLRYLYDICAVMSPIGGRGDQTLDFIQKEVIPYVTEVLDIRLRTERLGIIGYSLGGLMACYAAWTRAEVFSSAACQSPSFWWPYNNKTTDQVDFDFINITLKNPQLSVNRPSQRIYLDAGGEETLSPFQQTQMTVQVAQEIAGMGNYEMNKNVWVFVEPDKGHDFVEWGKRFSMAIGNLLPAGGDPHMPVEQAAPPVG